VSEPIGINPQTPRPIIDALRTVPVFKDLTEEQLTWLADEGKELRYEPGELLVREGDPAELMFVLLEGEVRYQASTPDATVYIGRAGKVTGMLPFSRLTHYSGNVRVTQKAWGLSLHKDQFPEMLFFIPELGPRLVGVMADRIREQARQTQQRDKLMALGKLSAGLAHELNNPASAARRGAVNLRECVRILSEVNHRLTQLSLSQDQSRCIGEFERMAVEHLDSWIPLDSLERSDREEAVGLWLSGQGIENSWQLAPSLVDANFDVYKLSQIAERFPYKLLGPVLERVAAALSVERLLRGIEHSTDQITNLVQSIKEYTYMDEAPEQEIDLHRGIENTLTMLGHCLKAGVRVIKQYDPALPKVCAWGSELNQVWTNIIDNALEAMHEHGVLKVRTAKEFDMALVEISDNGPGIPEAIQDRIFEPFFTTKEVGEGTGLGLDMVYRIVKKHHGDIRFTSKPGETVFQVRIPFVQPDVTHVSDHADSVPV
jgi:signal transduction histidine kinase